MYDPGSNIISENSIALHRNENLFIDSDFISRLANQALQNIQLNIYPDSNSLELRGKIAELHGCSPEEVYIGNGADGVLSDLLHYFRRKFDEIALQSRTYQVYPYLCTRYGYVQKRIDETDKLWVIDSPNSIDGLTFDFDALKEPPKFLIWDNVYGEFDLENRAPELNNTTIIRVNSFSKFYALAGLRVGYCIGHRDLIAKLNARKDIFNVNKFAQKMAVLALENKDYFISILPDIMSAKARLISCLSDLGFNVVNGKANFIWVSHPGIESFKLADSLSKQGIYVRHFQAESLRQGLRIAIPPDQIIDKLLSVLREIHIRAT
jgi:histidinol-phosphate aminotransferase